MLKWKSLTAAVQHLTLKAYCSVKTYTQTVGHDTTLSLYKVLRASCLGHSTTQQPTSLCA
jgi:hypothetical protein